MVGLRRDVGLSLNEIVEIMRRCHDRSLSSSAIYRCLKRHHVAGRPLRSSRTRGQTSETVTQPGFIHLDVKHLTTFKGRRSLSLSKGEVLHDLKQATARGFIERFLQDFPLRVRVILTDCGMAWTDRCNHRVKKKPTGRYPVDRLCQTRQSQHRLTRPRSPQTNGRVERFHRRLNEVIARKTKIQDNNGKNSFRSHSDRNRFISPFIHNSNHTRWQRLNYQAPIQCPYNHAKQYTCAGMRGGIPTCTGRLRAFAHTGRRQVRAFLRMTPS